MRLMVPSRRLVLLLVLTALIVLLTYSAGYVHLRHRYAADVATTTSFSPQPVTVVPDTASGHVLYVLYFPVMWVDRTINARYFHLLKRQGVSYKFLHIPHDEFLELYPGARRSDQGR